MKVMFQRVPKPSPFPILLGEIVRVEGMAVQGIVTGVLAAPDDGLGGFFVEITEPDVWAGIPDEFPDPEVPWWSGP